MNTIVLAQLEQSVAWVVEINFLKELRQKIHAVSREKVKNIQSPFLKSFDRVEQGGSLFDLPLQDLVMAGLRQNKLRPQVVELVENLLLGRLERFGKSLIH